MRGMDVWNEVDRAKRDILRDATELRVERREGWNRTFDTEDCGRLGMVRIGLCTEDRDGHVMSGTGHCTEDNDCKVV